MKISGDQRGSSHLVVLMAVVTLVVIGAVGYRVMKSNNGLASVTSPAHSATVPNQIKSSSDLRQAGKALDNTAIDSSVSPNQLDSDLNSLL